MCVCVNERKKGKCETEEIHRKSINYAYFAFASCISFTPSGWASRAVAGGKKIKHNLHNQVSNHCLHYLSYSATHSRFFRYNLLVLRTFFVSRCWISEPVFVLITVIRVWNVYVVVFLVLVFLFTQHADDNLSHCFECYYDPSSTDSLCASDRDTESLARNAFIYGCIVLHTWFHSCILFF